MKINKQLIKDGYISERKHPECDYYIYNYTSKAQYQKQWDEDTLKCRGLILDNDGRVIARPFSKFFNYEEYGQGSNLGEFPSYKSFQVTEKLDGSLGILYTMPNGQLRIATRGSFESEQSKVATEIFKEKFGNKFPKSLEITFLFEIIYPSNRIVVDYGQTKDLILLAGVNKITGEELPYIELVKIAEKSECSIVKKYDGIGDFTTIKDDFVIDNAEGFVVQLDTGLRVKLKFDEYVRLHRIVTGLNSKSIWDLLRRGENLEELLEFVPDEFYDWAEQIKNGFEMNYKSIEHSCQTIVNKCKLKERKDVAEYFCNKENKMYKGILFFMYDNKDYEDVIWKMLKPKFMLPFNNKEDKENAL